VNTYFFINKIIREYAALFSVGITHLPGKNIKKLIGNFGAIYVRIMHANFQANSFTGEGGE